MPKVFIKNILQEIKHSLGRFFSILCIVAIGVAFFAGIKASAPDMKYSADQYFDTYNVQDIQVYSTLGLTKDDLTKIKEIKGVDAAEPVFSIDTLTKKDSTELVMKVFSLPTNKAINKVRLVQGRFPKNDDECIIEAGSVSNQLFGSFEIGDTITLTSGTKDKLSDTLKRTKYKVVGTCYNPNYLSYEKGASTIGSGEVGSFMYINESNIKADYYTEIDVTVNNTTQLNTYSDEYFDLVEPVRKSIENIADDRIKARISEQQKVVDDARNKLIKEFDKAQKQIDDGNKQIQEGFNEIYINEQKLYDSKALLDQGWKEYNENVKVLDNLPIVNDAINKIHQGIENKQNIKDAITQIENGLIQLEDAKTKMQYIYDETIKYYDKLVSIKNQLEQDLVNDPENETIKKELALVSGAIQLSDQTISIYNGLIAKIEEMYQTKSSLENTLLEIETGEKQLPELEQNKLQLEDAKVQLDKAYNQLLAGQAEYDDGLAQFNSAKAKLESSQQELDRNQEKLNKEKQKNLKKLEDAQKEINELKGEWIVLDRNSHYSYRDYGACADRMDGIAKVFPVFFFLVAALVCMTTMTRMVDEQRNEIGTLKALGYSKMQIASKYLLYALSASILGSIIGCIIGMSLFPYVIFTAWNTLYNLEQIHFAFQPALMISASASVTGITLLATLYSIYNELIDVPSQLMRPKAGKAGKKILLERIPILWNRLSFLHKVTARNLFRYKKRFFMTVIGIAGCSALLVAGFGINDSISDIVHQQFEVINHFDATLNVDAKANDISEKILKEDGVQDVFKEETLPVTTMISDKEAAVTVHIIDDAKALKEYTTLKSLHSDQELELKDGQAIISLKMANKLNKKVNDTITVKDSDGYEISIKIGGIYENYVGHNIYVTKNTYEKWYSVADTTTTYLLKNKDTSDDFENKLGQNLMNIEDVKSITFYSSLATNFKNMISSISMVVVVLVISAAALAFVVLYNLSNVNISERMREIATIKVLGFTQRETSQYVNRESLLLTIIGGIIGLGVGIVLHGLIMNLAELDDVMFGRTIKPISFVISFILTIIFSIFINIIMQRKLKAIQMVESLKAVE